MGARPRGDMGERGRNRGNLTQSMGRGVEQGATASIEGGAASSMPAQALRSPTGDGTTPINAAMSALNIQG